MIKTMNFMGVPGPTTRTASTDTAQSISASVITSSGRTMQGMILSVDSQPIRIAFGGTAPTQGATGIGHTLHKDLDPVIIMGADLCDTMQFISATNSSHGGLHVTPLYAT